MSEEEIIKECKRIIFEYGCIRQDTEGEKEDLQTLEGLLNLYNKEKEENKKLKKYDYRNIKLDEKNKISSIHFTQEQLDLMNFGIALYVGIPKILADEKDEESDI